MLSQNTQNTLPNIFKKRRYINPFDDSFDLFGTNDLFLKRPFMVDDLIVNDDLKTNIIQKGDICEFNIEVPGVKKEDIKISIENGMLVVNVEFSSNAEMSDKEGKVIKQERFYEDKTRSFYIGNNTTYEDVEAKLNNGVLTIDVKQKQESEDKKYISIN